MPDAIRKAREQTRLNEKEDTKMKNESVKTGMRIGATIGTLILLQKLMGVVEPTLFVRAAVVCGIVVGIACAAAVSLVIGGLVGSALGYVVSAPATMRQAGSKA
jgi:hypothetical protein